MAEDEEAVRRDASLERRMWFAGVHTGVVAGILLIHPSAFLLEQPHLGRLTATPAESEGPWDRRREGPGMGERMPKECGVLVHAAWLLGAFPAVGLLFAGLRRRRKVWLLPWLSWAAVQSVLVLINLCVDVAIWSLYDSSLQSLSVFLVVQYAHLPLLVFSLLSGLRKYAAEEERGQAAVRAWWRRQRQDPRASLSSNLPHSLSSNDSHFLPLPSPRHHISLSAADIHLCPLTPNLSPRSSPARNPSPSLPPMLSR